jgi:hypothetical protein
VPQVSIPIIDQLVHPSFALLTRVALPANPYSVFLAIAPPQGISALTYGCTFKVHTVPPKWGLTLGAPDVYEPPIAQVSTRYTDLSSLGIIQQVEYVQYDDQVYFWQEPLPTLLVVYFAPGVSLDLYWMQT